MSYISRLISWRVIRLIICIWVLSLGLILAVNRGVVRVKGQQNKAKVLRRYVLECSRFVLVGGITVVVFLSAAIFNVLGWLEPRYAVGNGT